MDHNRVQQDATRERPVSKTIKPQFDFVSITHPDEIKDKVVKRKIHQHVMKGVGLQRKRNMANFGQSTALHLAKPQKMAAREDDEPEPLSVVAASSAVSEPRLPIRLGSVTGVRAQTMNAFCEFCPQDDWLHARFIMDSSYISHHTSISTAFGVLYESERTMLLFGHA
jgi:hypothetical protein